jgi:hypothetical protein
MCTWAWLTLATGLQRLAGSQNALRSLRLSFLGADEGVRMHILAAQLRMQNIYMQISCESCDPRAKRT